MSLFDEDALRQLVREAVREVLAEERAHEPERGEYLSVARAAQVAEVSAGTIREWIALGRLRRHQAGRELRVRRDELDALLAGQAAPPPALAGPAPAGAESGELTPEQEAARVIALEDHRDRG